MTKRIAIPDGHFHACECLCVYFLRNTKEFEGAEVIRTRDAAILAECDAVCAVGGVYDHSHRRYDHHQLSFEDTFPECQIPLSACGTIYRHFGQEVVTNILARTDRDIQSYAKYLYESMYWEFVKEIDAEENAVGACEGHVDLVYDIHTGITSRVWMMNSDSDFDHALELIAREFEAMLVYMFDSRIPAIDAVRSSFDKRMEVDESGKIMVLEEACGFQGHLKDIERANGGECILFVVTGRTDGTWGIVTISTGGFGMRKPLPFAGLRDAELSEACGIPGAVFVHRNAFIGAFRTKEGAIEFAKLAVKSK